jgi:coenzyme F420 hydrogenase subunit beta
MWRENLSTKEKLQSTVGTVRRIRRKRLRDAADLTPME